MTNPHQAQIIRELRARIAAGDHSVLSDPRATAILAKEQAELDADISQLTQVLKAQAEKQSELQEKQGELQARLLEAEQKLIHSDVRDRTPRDRSNTNPVASNFAACDQVNAFRAGMPTSGRLQITSGLRAALTNTGRGDGGSIAYPTAPERAPGILGTPATRLNLLDALPVLPVGAPVFEFVTIDAVPVADYQLKEGAEKAESTVTPQLKRAEVATIAHHMTASLQVLNDNAGLEQQMSEVLGTGCRLKLEHQLLNGAGGEGEIAGLLKQATVAAPVAATPADRIGEVLTALQADGWEPRLIVMHPSDWFGIASVRDTSGGYVLGSPRDPAPAALWGVPVVLSASMPSGKALVLDTAQVAVLDRESVEVEASRHHNGNFTRNMVTLLAELRAGLAVFAPSAVRLLDLQPNP